MRHHAAATLKFWTSVLIATLGGVATAAPLFVGALNPARVRAQTPTVDAKPPAFEVASIKPNKSGDGRIGVGFAPGGRFTANNITLGVLLGQAYRLQGGRGNNNPQILNAPGWISSDHFDIVAKADANVPPDQFPELIKSLLIERFKLAAHIESRELQVYALVVARSDGKLGPGLRPASAECAAMIAARGRSGPPPGGPGDPGGRDSAGGVGRGPIGPPLPGQPMPCGMIRFGPGSLTAGGTPIAQLATSLAPWVNRIVVDKTGLTGPFEVDLTWTPDQMPQGGPGAGPGGPPPGGFPPIDPNGPSIFTAVQEQLGLKLDSTKSPVDVVVIDHVERPAEE
jgi:uncharacterized protein (TIGR03435 family)